MSQEKGQTMTQNKTSHRIRRITWLTVGLALIISPLGPTVAPVNAITETEPSSTSATSLYLSNWEDLMGIAMSSRLTQTDTGTYGPRLGELRFSGSWSTSPDLEQGAYDDLSYSTGSDVGGAYVQFTVPRLEYWDMIVVEMDR